jgi:hypothetical protein
MDYAGCAGDDGTNGYLVRTGTPAITWSWATDGAASTILLGEKQLAYGRPTGTWDDNEPYVAPGWDSEVFRLGSQDYPPGHDTLHPSLVPGANYDVGSISFGSSHISYFIVACGDASVHNVGYNVDHEVFRRLCVRNDGFNANIGNTQESWTKN